MYLKPFPGSMLRAALALVLLSTSWFASGATQVSYYNDLIVFQFGGDYTVGKFANGDYWVHNNGGNVIITKITPESAVVSGRTINGTMLNPENSTVQGYDSESRDMTYSAALNVDPGILGSSLTVAPGSSLIKSISMESDAGRPIIQDAVVLTVLASSPPANAFRPPYTGADKSIIATTDDINLNALGRFQRLGGEPDIISYASKFERVWLEHDTQYTQRDIHPKNNMPAYGRDIADMSGKGLVLLQLDYPNNEKMPLLIGMLQYGIDIYGVARTGASWKNNGGHNLGRKMPLLLAGKVFNNADMLKYADAAQNFIFQDDHQHFYVSQTEVDMTASSAWDPDDRNEIAPYTSADIGMPEWGIRHFDKPHLDNRAWSATYRNVNGFAQSYHVFAARLMGVMDDWNWTPTFDYIDRWYNSEKASYSTWFQGLWSAYRAQDQSKPEKPTAVTIQQVES